MKKNPKEKQELRNVRIYELYKRGAYTMQGLANMFRLSKPRICAIVKEYREKEKKSSL